MARQEYTPAPRGEWVPDSAGSGSAEHSGSGRSRSREHSTETKASFKTTEFIAFVATVVGVLIATALVDSGDDGSLGARQGWTLVTALTIGYMVSRGLAKAGSREPYSE